MAFPWHSKSEGFLICMLQMHLLLSNVLGFIISCSIMPASNALVCHDRFELPYVSVLLSPELVKSWEEPSEAMIQGLSLPPPNHYIPTDFSLRSSTDDANESSSQAAQIKEAAATLLKGISMEDEQVQCTPGFYANHVAEIFQDS